MKTKQIGIRVTNEEYDLIYKTRLDMTIKERKEFTLTAFLLRLVKEYANGNEPPVIQEEQKIDSKDTKQDGKQPEGFFDGINLDF